MELTNRFGQLLTIKEIDSDHEIDLSVDCHTYSLTIEDAKKVVYFLLKQLNNEKTIS